MQIDIYKYYGYYKTDIPIDNDNIEKEDNETEENYFGLGIDAVGTGTDLCQKSCNDSH